MHNTYIQHNTCRHITYMHNTYIQHNTCRHITYMHNTYIQNNTCGHITYMHNTYIQNNTSGHGIFTVWWSRLLLWCLEYYNQLTVSRSGTPRCVQLLSVLQVACLQWRKREGINGDCPLRAVNLTVCYM